MKTVFVITSAIATKHGVFTPEQRLEQTVNTLTSIRQRTTDAYLLILDSSMERALNQEEKGKLLANADAIIDLHTDQDIKAIYDNVESHDIVKNQSEMIILSKGFSYVRAHLKEYDRVFKISGRYELTDNFNISLYDQPELKGKFVVKRRFASQFPANLTGGISAQFMCRLYSFPYDRLTEMVNAHTNMLMAFSHNIQRGIYTDLEHSLFRQFGNSPSTAEVETIGVRGILGPNGVAVED